MIEQPLPDDYESGMFEVLLKNPDTKLLDGRFENPLSWDGVEPYVFETRAEARETMMAFVDLIKENANEDIEMSGFEPGRYGLAVVNYFDPEKCTIFERGGPDVLIFDAHGHHYRGKDKLPDWAKGAITGKIGRRPPMQDRPEAPPTHGVQDAAETSDVPDFRPELSYGFAPTRRRVYRRSQTPRPTR